MLKLMNENLSTQKKEAMNEWIATMYDGESSASAFEKVLAQLAGENHT